MTRLLLSALFAVLFAGVAHADFAAGQAAFEQGDFAAALGEWQPLAEGGDADAQLGLGELYLQGQGVDQDFKAAAEWLTKAAEAGHPRAQAMLAGLYATGLGVPQEFSTSYFWMIVAAIWSQDEIRLAAMESLGEVAKQVSKDEKIAIGKQAAAQWRR
jgi:TPR repeat protein